MLAGYFERFSFQTKTLALVVVLFSFTLVVVFRYHFLVGEISEVSVRESSDTILRGYKNELQDLVDVMAVALASAAQDAQNEEQVYASFSRLVRDVRFLPDRSGYYFIYKTGGRVFVHAAQPELETRNLFDLQDPKGKYVIRELDQVARAGGGYVEYWWEKPGKGVLPKLSYARLIPGGRYWIGAGVYIEDIQERKEAIQADMDGRTRSFLRKLYVMLALALFFFALPLTWLLIVSIVKPIRELTAVADEFSRGSIDLVIPHAGRNDEIGKLAKALERLGMSIKVAISRLRT